MKEYICERFHVEQLLTAGDVNIRKLIEEHPMTTADEYFLRLEQFVEKLPRFAEKLCEGVTPSMVAEMKEEMAQVGCYALIPDLDRVAEAAWKQPIDKRFAEETADKIRALHDRMKGALVKKKRSAPSATAAPSAAAAAAAPAEEEELLFEEEVAYLSEAMEYFDYVEENRKLRILAVDDIAVALNTITSVLSPHYEVFALTKASQVEGFLAQVTPELFLLDIEMPDMHGYELLSLIRSFPEHKDTPIMFLTGNATAENLKSAVSLGACDFVTKPVNREILLEKVGSKIVRKRAF